MKPKINWIVKKSLRAFGIIGNLMAYAIYIDIGVSHIIPHNLCKKQPLIQSGRDLILVE